ncbi:MAG: glycosyltransferase [Candidatus Zambryskibacteria bacterium]|nr:glycosyltransferase [Candidatus Zambryskibacteria bacterium]
MNSGGLKVLMISSDRNILTPGSAVSERMKEYGALVEELHIVLLCDRSHTKSLGIESSKLKIAEGVHVYPTNSSYKYFRPLDAVKIGKKIVLKNKFVRGLSVITVQDPFECGWAGLKIKNKWRIPLEVQLHTDPYSNNFKGLQNLARRRQLGRTLGAADSVRVVSQFLKEKVSQSTPAPVTVLPIFVDRTRIENAPLSFDIHTLYPWHFIILMVCRLEPEKNIPLALNILKGVRERFPDAGLLIVGKGSQEGNLKSLVKKLGLEGAVEFAGWQENLASYYKSANAFLQTSLFEGYGLALVEAGLSGLPVVTTPVGLASELGPGKDAYIYTATETSLFIDGLCDLIENNQKRENLRLNLRKTLEAKLLSKEDYLQRLKEEWEETSKRIK